MKMISECTRDNIREAALSLITGNLVAFPTETVYGLGADACNESAVSKIYKVKGRPSNHPLIVHISKIHRLDRWVEKIPEYAMKLAASFWPGPMTLILPKSKLAKAFITGSQNNVGIRIPSHPISLRLLEEFEALGGLGVAAPSANKFGKVSPTSAEAVCNELSNHLSSSDSILNGGSCRIGIESTIIDCTGLFPRILRPGKITHEDLIKIPNLAYQEFDSKYETKLKAPGLLNSHYSPNAQVIISGNPQAGDGLIAMSNILTPKGVIRLASPSSDVEFARILYKAFRLADSKGISRVFVVPVKNVGLGIAINDRLYKAAN
jgi:L-threonylcarbamoyladenylate synthase